MKISFCYPPFSKNGRFANLPQNRQFIYTASREVRIFPVVMATAATWLKNLGHEILWLDGITRRMDWYNYERLLFSFGPDLLILEGKAPLMEKTWGYIDKFKAKNPGTKIVLVGDHVTYFPRESWEKSHVDFILTGGDYDFLLKNLVGHLEGKENLEPGIWYRNKSKIKNTGNFELNHKLADLPLIDRKLTRWKDYGEAYLYRPCAYVMFGRGCGLKKGTGACTFCIWQHGLWRCSARLVAPSKAIAEVKNLVTLRVKEIFDDTESGVLADYSWLEKFYELLKKENLLGKVTFSSNARGDQLDRKTCRLLKKIGYRMLKVGVESGNNQTLKMINKKEEVGEIIRGVKNAKDEGLRVMLTVMTGYPWENTEDVNKTYKVVRDLMFYRTKAGDCLQASVLTPYPGTPMWQEAEKNGWLTVKHDDYKSYDMSKPVLKSNIDSRKWCQKIWAIQREPGFIIRSGLTVKTADDIILLLRGAKSLVAHLLDFSK